MVRFSCFPAHLQHRRTKKSVERHPRDPQSSEMCNNPPEYFQVSPSSASSCQKIEDNLSNCNPDQTASHSSFEYCCKSEDLNVKFCTENDKDGNQSMQMKKCQSLGSGLDRGLSCVTEGTLAQDSSLECNVNLGVGFNSFNDHHPTNVYTDDGSGINFLNQEPDNASVHTIENVNPAQHESIFSIGDFKQCDRVPHEENQDQSSTKQVDLGHFQHKAVCHISRSRSLSGIAIIAANDGEPTSHVLLNRSRSCQHLCSINTNNEEVKGQEEFQLGFSGIQLINSSFCHGMPLPSNFVENDEFLCQVDTKEENTPFNGENDGDVLLIHVKYPCSQFDNDFQSQELNSLANGKNILFDGRNERDASVMQEENPCNQFDDDYQSQKLNILSHDGGESEVQAAVGSNNHEESSFRIWDNIPSNEFNRKRIEDWLSELEVPDDLSVPENGEGCSCELDLKEHHIDTSVAISKNETRGITTKPERESTPGMETAYRYISSMTAISTTAQMSNLGLVVIPFLSAFYGLRLLNLAGNFIVRITAGALPRGLHMLNLSKNHISVIEGLRELTRLRVLDLSYNKILKIGHGLSGCLSLKELYLAGNKINEVEGLHRLLKLNILDLKFNKIYTTKYLGQLASNYGSLQSINLEGNPAQKNIGDEQLRRFLLSVLPHLVNYNNRQLIRTNSKEFSDRSSRSFSSHQLDRSLRSEQKRSRRHHNVPLKPSTLSSNGKSSHTLSSLLKHQSRGRQAPLPPPVIYKPNPNNYLLNTSSKPLSFRPSDPMRRSRSEGNL